MFTSPSLTTSARRSSIAPTHEAATASAESTILPAAHGLRASTRQFFSGLARFFGFGGRDERPGPMPASLLAQLRPPPTGRISFFFGRLSTLSERQLRQAQREHEALRASADGLPPVSPGPQTVPGALGQCLRITAAKKPDEIFDTLCGQWRPAESPVVAQLQGQARAFLRSQPSHDATLQALGQVLRAANRGQSQAQLDARVKAVYAALVGSVRQHDAEHPGSCVIDGLAARIAALEAGESTPQSLPGRVRELAGVEAGLNGAGHSEPREPRLPALRARCLAVRQVQQAQLRECLSSEGRSFAQRTMADAQPQLAAARARLDALRGALDALHHGWTGDDLAACEAHAAAFQDDADAVAASTDVFKSYAGIAQMVPQSAGAAHRPCELLADFLFHSRVTDYRNVQGQIDVVCTLADPEGSADLLVALEAGVTGKDGQIKDRLIQDLQEGLPASVDAILPASQWDALALAIKLAGVDRRGAKLADPAREKFAIETRHRLRELNAELNRLLLAKDPKRQLDLLGRGGAFADASEASIQAVLEKAGDLGSDLDVLLLNWIYCSCLDPATLQINQGRAAALWAVAKGKPSPLPGADEAHVLLLQGFCSTVAVKDVHQRINSFSRLLADAEVLAATSHDHDPLVAPRGLLGELHAGLTGREGVDPADAAFSQLLAQQVDAARQEWSAARGVVATAMDRAVKKRDAAFARLEGKGWRLPLLATGQPVATLDGSNVQPRQVLRDLVLCLRMVPDVEDLVKSSPTQASQRIQEQFLPLAQGLPRHFDLQRKAVRAAQGAAPSYGEIKRLLVTHPQVADDIEAWLTACDAYDKAAAWPVDPAASEKLTAVVEAVVRMAVLQEAIANANADFKTRHKDGATLSPADNVIRRLQACGVGSADPIPEISSAVLTLPGRLRARFRDLAGLCKALDPLNPLAQGVLHPRVPASPRLTPGLAGALARGRAYLRLRDERRRLDNQQAVRQRFRDLEANQAFDIYLGRRGQATIGYPVVPGVSLSGSLAVSLSRGVRVFRTNESTYEVDIVGTKSATLAGSASVLSALVKGSVQQRAARTDGFRVTCASPQDAEDLVSALLGGQPLDITSKPSMQVKALRVRETDRKASFNAELLVSGPADMALLKLEAQLDASSGTKVEATVWPFLRRERRTHTRAWNASASAGVLDGRLQRGAERGAQVAVTRTCTRRAGALTGEVGLSVRSRIVADDVRGSLRRVMPHLADAELDHYGEQVEQTLEAAGAEGQWVDIELECVMTPQGRSQANRHYRMAGEWLRMPDLAAGVAQHKAQAALEDADHSLRNPANYVVRSVGLVLQSSKESPEDGTGPVTETAQVSAERRLKIPLHGPAGGPPMTLPDNQGYEALLGRPG